MATGAPPNGEKAAAVLTRGSTIGRYVVLALVGRGAMGEVYAAYDPELDRKVALKLVRANPGNGLSTIEGRHRTLREAQAIARLSHPNVVVVYDVGTFKDQVFIAMEFIEGNTVGYWLEAHPRSWQDVLRVFMAAGQGLSAAHEKGLVHRDFKPDNVMVGRDGEVRVMDFGLARQVGSAPNADLLERRVSVDVMRGQSPPGGAPQSAIGAPPGHAPADASLSATSARPSEPVTGEPISSGAVDTAREPVQSSGPTSPAPPVEAEVVSTVVLNGGGRVALGQPLPSSSASSVPGLPSDVVTSSGMFGVQLTRTGAVMGTPAYMAPEQFLGTATDARSDQFSFCVALYEALYGQRPFDGNTMFVLTANVVQGKVKEAPSNSKVPLWLRRVLLRGLKPAPADRWPSMQALLHALTKNPAAARRKWIVGAMVALLPFAVAFAVRETMEDRDAICGGGPGQLAGVWELRGPHDAEPPRHARIRSAFLQTRKTYAEDAFASASRLLTKYAQGWAKMYRETCQATHVRHEQSPEVLDLRMSCLQERLAGLRALTDVFSDASGEVVENAVNAANALGSLERCADVRLLRAVVRPPEDPETRKRVDALRGRLSELKAQFDAGRWKDVMSAAPQLVAETRAAGYQPLVADSLLLLGMMLSKASDGAGSERALTEAFWAADRSRHDEARAEAATDLVYVVGYQEGRVADSKLWANTADAVLKRLGGHEPLQGWLLNNLGASYDLAGEREAALDSYRRAVTVKERALGDDHPDVGISEGNLATALGEAGRQQEALTHVDRSIALLEGGLGAGHPDLAVQLNNRGEILNGLGRHAEARRSFERARIIWERELGPENVDVAYALTGIGISYLGEDDAANAIAPLEKAYKIREAEESNVEKRAETRFALARALWQTNRQRARALSLAEAARQALANVAPGDVGNPSRGEVESWLASRTRG